MNKINNCQKIEQVTHVGFICQNSTVETPGYSVKVVRSQQQRHQSDVIDIVPLSLLLTDIKRIFNASNVEFEQVNASWKVYHL